MKKNFILIILLIIPIGLGFSQYWDPYVSDCYQSLERFFYNGKENRTNLQRIWYDRENRIVMSAFINNDGSERSRKTYLYDTEGNLMDFAIWDIRDGIWIRWWHTVLELVSSEDVNIYTKKAKRYSDDYLVSSIVIKNGDRSISSAAFGFDGSESFKQFNDNGDLIWHQWENEKSDGNIVDTYIYEYDGANIKTVEHYRKGELVNTRTNTYSEGRLAGSEIHDEMSGSITRLQFTYENGKLISRLRLDGEGELLFENYSEYDENGRLQKRGERSSSYERYWLYDVE